MRVFERKSEPKSGTLHLNSAIIQPPAVPAKKPNIDGVITLIVNLPNGEIRVRFLKRNVLANAHVSQLTKQNFERVILNALDPLLGRVETMPEEKEAPL